VCKKYIVISSELSLSIPAVESLWLSVLVAVYYAGSVAIHLQANYVHSVNIHPFCSNKTSLNIAGTEPGTRASMATTLPKR
jgi:hypothetical protein